MAARILVLGLGNRLLTDEGVGVRALERLEERYVFSDGVFLLDGGTLGLDLLPHLSGCSHLLILDAVQADRPAASQMRLEGDEIPAFLANKVSMHQVGLHELLAAASFQGDIPRHRVLLGIQPALIDWGSDLSPKVFATLDTLVGSAVEQLRAWGANITARHPRSSV